MTVDPTPDPFALLAAGALPADEAAALADRVAAGDCGGFGAVVALLAAGVPAVTPPPRVRANLLASLPPQTGRDDRAADRRAAAALAGVAFAFADDDGFAPTAYPGFALRVLNRDPVRHRFTALIRLAPGGVIPEHPHDEPEECLVLAGELTIGDVRMRAGDYQRVEPGADHPVQRSATGCLLYVTGPLSLLAS